MSARYPASTAAERYDHALRYARDFRLPAAVPRPQLTSAWPAENVALLERYRAWLLASGTSQRAADGLYLPMAGHVLGLALKPHPQLDLETDLAPALAYIQAKGLSAEWIVMCRGALGRFRRFLRQARGVVEIAFRTPDLTRYTQGLPDWLVTALERYQRLRQPHWRAGRLQQQLVGFWLHHTRLWRWLCERHPIAELKDVQRRWLLDYAADRLAAGYAPSGVNQDLRDGHALLLFLQEEGYPVPQALLRLPSVKEPDRLPRFLTDEQVRALRDDCEQRVSAAAYPAARRETLLDRALFYLLWQGGLRRGEVEELRLEDLDLAARRLTVRCGKGQRDRTVYLTATAVGAIRTYLAVRGPGPSSHVFLYRNEPLKKDLVSSRIQLAGQRVGVKVHPHRLRHTFATQLLNAGCRITSIQKLLGHLRLNSTMRYARVHDQTAADDYYAAMAHIEARLQLAPLVSEPGQPVAADERAHLLDLATSLAAPDLSVEVRLGLVERLRSVLVADAPVSAVPVASDDANQRDPPVSLAPVEADQVLAG